ncbi:SDR family oxidoreductase, partial [Klebsiella michiganensis]
MSKKHVLIAGSSGTLGRAAVQTFENAGWDITTLSRSDNSDTLNDHVAADLLEPESLKAGAHYFKTVTHLVYTALKPNSDPAASADENAAMLENLVAALRSADAPLERIIFIQGGKVYGAQFGVYKTPARESDSRHFPPNLYFRHEDFAISLQSEGIKWTALRPDIIIGHSLGSPMNLGNLIGVYGTLCRETGTAMNFPGPEAAYRNADGAYNITNGDIFRWAHVWPRLADFFGIEAGEPQPISLAQRVPALSSVWRSVAQNKALIEPDVNRIALGSFGVFIFHVQNLSKLQSAASRIGHHTETAILDTADDSAVQRFFREAGGFDHVVVSAAQTPTGPVRELPLDDAHQAMNSKFWGAYRVARHVQINEGGSLTFVSGFLSVRPSTPVLQGAINAALEALGRGLALELASSKVRVN